MQLSPNRQLEKFFRLTEFWGKSLRAKGRGNVLSVLFLTEVLEFVCVLKATVR